MNGYPLIGELKYRDRQAFTLTITPKVNLLLLIHLSPKCMSAGLWETTKTQGIHTNSTENIPLALSDH